MDRGGRPGTVRPGQVVELEIHGLDHSGAGVGRHEGLVLFVPGALPGERVRARVSEVKKRFGRGSLEEVIAPAPARVQPPCPVYAECGGCQLQHLDYAAQLREKRQRVVDALERIGRLSGVPVHPVLGMADPWHYRNKAQFPVGVQGGRVVAGPYAPGTHRIVPVEECAIQHPVANRVLAAVTRLARRLHIPAYDEQAHTGELRHVLVRVLSGDRAMVVLVTRTPRLTAAAELVQGLQEAVPEAAIIWQNVNPQRTNVILGEQMVHLAGAEYLVEEMGALRFRVSPRSFLQVNPEQVQVLYGQVVRYLAAGPDDTVVDVYCGIGTISLLVAGRVGHVYGIEAVPEAIADARANARLNGLANTTFQAGPAEVLLPRLVASGVRPAAVILDPPRRGCEPAVLDAAVQMGPRQIIYVSCNPTTLARDLARLGEQGYRTVEVQPVDMFPHTAHVECCALLVRDKLGGPGHTQAPPPPACSGGGGPIPMVPVTRPAGLAAGAPAAAWA